MSEDDDIIPFHKNPGFLGEWSNVAASTYDLLTILRYCASDEMDYRPEVKQTGLAVERIRHTGSS